LKSIAGTSLFHGTLREGQTTMTHFLPAILLSGLLVSCESPAPQPSPGDARGRAQANVAQGVGSTGIWENGRYADELGQTSERECIRNKDIIAGSFSNASTPHSPLNVRFLIFNPTSISFQLFEYGRNNPVTALSPKSYTVSIEESDGGKQKFRAMNYSDKLAFEKTDAKAVHDILMKGGKIQFSIVDDFNAKTQYQFTIENAGGYDEAYKNLTEK
jgi:hypothetical protein